MQQRPPQRGEVPHGVLDLRHRPRRHLGQIHHHEERERGRERGGGRTGAGERSWSLVELPSDVLLKLVVFFRPADTFMASQVPNRVALFLSIQQPTFDTAAWNFHPCLRSLSFAFRYCFCLLRNKFLRGRASISQSCLGMYSHPIVGFNSSISQSCLGTYSHPIVGFNSIISQSCLGTYSNPIVGFNSCFLISPA